MAIFMTILEALDSAQFDLLLLADSKRLQFDSGIDGFARSMPELMAKVGRYSGQPWVYRYNHLRSQYGRSTGNTRWPNGRCGPLHKHRWSAHLAPCEDFFAELFIRSPSTIHQCARSSLRPARSLGAPAGLYRSG